MKHLLMTLILLFSLTACQDKENEAKIQAEHDAKIVAEAKAEVRAEYEAAKKAEAAKESKLNKMGVGIDNGKITIDTNKTKAFFNTLTKQMEGKVKEIADNLKKGVIEAKEEGIQMDNDHISIDPNKTKNFLETWGKKIQAFTKELDLADHSSNTNK